MKATWPAVVAALTLALSAGAAQAPGPARLASPKESDWRPPSNLPPGAEYVLIAEDPVSHGIQALVRFPSGYSVPAHSHSCTETLVVMSGKLAVGLGTETRILKAGDYAVFPPGAEHSLRTAGWRRAVFTATTDGAYDLRPAGQPPR
ncbi:MAG: cupin domain-containing protein [Elusimicrobia bacterium]|nr:cupin domain-containing protein [Elusimicrobiota bacterium]